MASQQSLRKKKFKAVSQKVKLFRASEPLISVLMWGVNHTVNQLTHVRIPVMLLPDDFKAYTKVKVDNLHFNKEAMPSHYKFKEYCPLVFRNLRERFGMNEATYLRALTRLQPEWDTSQGAHRHNKFLLSYDRRLFIKLVSMEDVAAMHSFLPKYHEYVVEQHAYTLLPHYLGMYRVRVNDQKLYVLVMRHMFSPRLRVLAKYDLKGSTVDREASAVERAQELPTLKDVDWLNDSSALLLGGAARDRLLAQLTRDLDFLQRAGIIGYSLLVGIATPDAGDDSPSGAAPAGEQAAMHAEELNEPYLYSEEELDGEDVMQLSGCAAGGSGAPAEAALSSPARRLHSPLHPSDPNNGSPASTTPKNESLPELDLSHLKGLSVSATVSATSSMATLNTEQPNVGARLAAVLEQQPSAQQSTPATTAAATTTTTNTTTATPPPSQAQAQHEPLASSGSLGARPTHVRSHYPPFVGELDAELEYYGLKSSFYDLASSAVQRSSSAGSGGSGAGAVAGPACESAAEAAPEAPTGQPRRCIYFLGIIDTLSKYDAKSRAAQAYKQVKHGAGAEISTARPDVYAKRLLEFVSRCSR